MTRPATEVPFEGISLQRTRNSRKGKRGIHAAFTMRLQIGPRDRRRDPGTTPGG